MTPEWLKIRGGELTPGINHATWLLLLDGSPQYKLVVVPAKGGFSCAVIQTNNGRRLDKAASGPTTEAALQAGLAELRETLGW